MTTYPAQTEKLNLQGVYKVAAEHIVQLQGTEVLATVLAERVAELSNEVTALCEANAQMSELLEAASGIAANNTIAFLTLGRLRLWLRDATVTDVHRQELNEILEGK